MTVDSFTTEDIGNISMKAARCLAEGVIDQKTCNKIHSAARRLLGALKKSLRDPGSADSVRFASDIAELREADRMLSGLLSTGRATPPAIEPKVLMFPAKHQQR